MTFDLNNPKDARDYVMTWVDQDRLSYEQPADLLRGSDEDLLRVAKQLFLYVDPRQPQGVIQ